MSNKTGKKGKKSLQTTLGKAVHHNENDVDLSHIQKPINTSVFGLRQVLSLFQTATKEVQNYVTYECDIIYECRMCRTIFRSLANFILHKREYCRERFNNIDCINNNEDIQEDTCLENTENDFDDESIQFSSDKNETSNTGTKKRLLPVIERLKEKQEIYQMAQDVLNEDLSSKEGVDDSSKTDTVNRHNDLLLEKIATNNAAVFQTVVRKSPTGDAKKLEFMKSEVMEIHGILDSDEAVLGPDGKICTFETNKINENPISPKNDWICPECNFKFSTKKTLTYHIKYKHNNTRLVYICPDCKDSFANVWCVYRHLYKVHRRTSAQIKRMRDQIHSSCVRKDQEPTKKQDRKLNERVDKADEENQWLSNIEGDNDIQMCGGCGKRFERKAALNSHAQMCTKRIAVCNTIKENNAKKKEEGFSKDQKNKSPKTDKVVLKGSSKRKPYLLRTYKYNEDENHENRKVTTSNEDNDICDVNANCEIVETTCDNNKDIAEEEIHKVTNSLSSSEDLLCPSKKDFVSSPSIEKIDTEKMLHIIGIITDCENGKNESTSDSNCAGDSTISNSEEHYLKSNSEEHLKESGSSHTASDFDLFCQSVAESLLTNTGGCTPGEIEEPPPKMEKTVPLILRRKNISKCERKNFILERNSQTSPHSDLLSEKETEVDVIGVKSMAETNDSDELVISPPQTKCKINVKSLADLIGVSPQDHKKNSNKEETTDVPTNPELNDDLFFTSTTNETSNKLTGDVSDEKICGNCHRNCMKRQRTSSFDITEFHKYSKQSKGDCSNKQDRNFISRASPFMDQNQILCIPCQTTFPTIAKLLWHMSAHFSWFRFQCSRCSFISFNNLDCVNHARKAHGMKNESIQSVVLPIPNWKTVLMAHDFDFVNEESGLGGKHTDEILSGSPEEIITSYDLDENKKNDEGDESEWTDTLFVESQDVDYEPESDLLQTDFTPNQYANNIFQENIDIINNDQESFQVEVPQEIYSPNVSELIGGVNYEERYCARIKIKELIAEDDDFSHFILTDNEQESFVNEIEIKSDASNAINERLLIQRNDEVNNFVDQECFKKDSEQAVNMRPTRNRTKSIKTIQDDFFYDLNKVIKLNHSSVNKSNAQKHKKSVSQKNTNSSGGKNSTNTFKVYAKRK